MFSRFRKKNMIMDKVPSNPDADDVYPKDLTAEYFQAIQDNTLFNHQGHENKPKEAFGYVTLVFSETFGQSGNRLDNISDDLKEANYYVSNRLLTINIDGTDPTGMTTNESVEKIGGVDNFTDGDSYIVLLTVDQFIGVDFDGPGTAVGGQTQPLLNPTFQAQDYNFGGDIADPRRAFQRHDQSTRPTWISLRVNQKTATTFEIHASRSNVFNQAIVWGDGDQRYIEVYDYRTNGPPMGTPPVRNSPYLSGQVSYTGLDSGATAPQFNASSYEEAISRNSLKVAWYAKGV